jgi:hypothetical protein
VALPLVEEEQVILSLIQFFVTASDFYNLVELLMLLLQVRRIRLVYSFQWEGEGKQVREGME